MIRFTKAAALAAFVLAGCTNVEFHKDTSPGFTFADAAGKNHFVTGERSYGGWGGEWIAVSIDGAQIMRGDLGHSSKSGNLSGTYANAPALAICTSSPRGWQRNSYAVACQIVLDGKPIGTLNF